MRRKQMPLWMIVLVLAGGMACRAVNQTMGIPPPTEIVETQRAPAMQATIPIIGEIPPSASPGVEPTLTATQIISASETPVPEMIRFAVIGDYGSGDQNAEDVANLVKSWEPDFIITVGDNNYPSGSPETIDQNIGQFYHEYIFPYRGTYDAGADELRFFPTLGNHDIDINRGQAYFDYFELPGNERYYDFVEGPIHFFALNTDSREPDGVGRSSIQANWLKERLAASTARWKIVYGHVPPYTSGLNGPVDWIVWPFKEWGATVYLCGHEHIYERLEVEGMPYIINGIGGGVIYDIGPAATGSIVRYNDDYGAILVEANEHQISFRFITRSGAVVDDYTIISNQP